MLQTSTPARGAGLSKQRFGHTLALWVGLMLAAVVLSGCFYDPRGADALDCDSDGDCPTGTSCVEQLCVIPVDMGEDAEPDQGMPDMEPDSPDLGPVVATIVVEPSEAEVPLGAKVQLSATVLDADGAELNVPVQWSSADISIATVDSSGAVSSVGPGVVSIQASAQNVVGEASVTVLAPVASVTLDPPSAQVGNGLSQQFTATALDDQGNALTGRNFSWRIADPSIAEVDSDGLVTGLTPGITAVEATSEGISGSAMVEVVDNPVASVEFDPADFDLFVDERVIFTAILKDAAGNELDPRGHTYQWTMSNMAVATLTGINVDHQRRVHAMNVGMVTMNVDVDGVTAKADITVTEPTVEMVALSLGSDPVPVGSTPAITATITGPGGIVITGRAETWASSDETVATVDSSGTLTALAPGTTTITLTVDGVIGTLDVNVAFLLDSVSAGTNHSCGVNPDGIVLCWGANDTGQLGIGGATDSATPVAVTIAGPVQEVAAGGDFSCALTGAGEVLCWGAAGRTGASDGSASATPRAIPSLTATAVAAGAGHACAVTTAGQIHCWGAGGSGQLGNGNSADSDSPVAVTITPMGTPSGVSAGALHSCTYTDAGNAYCWGAGSSGQLGDGNGADSDVAVAVSALTGVTALATGDALSCGLSGTTASCWGDNSDGALGINDMGTSTALAPMALAGAFSALSVGSAHACGIDSVSGLVSCWGSGSDFRLGNMDSNAQFAPAPVSGSLAATAIAAGDRHACAVGSDDVVYCWGANDRGQSGMNAASTLQIPAAVWP